jgi:hypothetical protein
VKTKDKTSDLEEDSTQEAVSETICGRKTRSEKNHTPLVEVKILLRQEKHTVTIPNILNSGLLQMEVYLLCHFA